MRTTVHLDDDVYQLVKSLASTENVSLGKMLSDLARKAIKLGSPRRAKSDFPVFEVRPGAAPLTPEKVKRALEEG